MAKSLDQIVQEQLGAMMIQIARLTAELDAAHERIAALEAEKKVGDGA